MALEIDFDICISNSCKAMTFTELTGAFSATNATGWGAPNPITSTITTALLQITDPGNSIYTIDLLAQGFPTSNSNLEYSIPFSSIGLGTGTVTDGQWKFLYYIVDTADPTSAVTYMAAHNFLFYCNSQCCVTNMLADIDADDCDCNIENTRRIDNYRKAKTFLASLIHAARCYQVTKFNNIKSIVDKLCQNSGCETCK